MFGRRKRKDALAVEAIRQQMSSADAQARAVLADAIAQMELRLREVEQRARRAPGEIAIESLQDSVLNSATDVASALGQVVNMCAIVTERLEADRIERRALTEAISRLSLPHSTTMEPAIRAIGGTVFSSPAVPSDLEISLVDADEDEAVGPGSYADVDGDAYDSYADTSTDTSDYVLTVLERLTDVVYRQRERDTGV